MGKRIEVAGWGHQISLGADVERPETGAGGSDEAQTLRESAWGNLDRPGSLRRAPLVGRRRPGSTVQLRLRRRGGGTRGVWARTSP